MPYVTPLNITRTRKPLLTSVSQTFNRPLSTHSGSPRTTLLNINNPLRLTHPSIPSTHPSLVLPKTRLHILRTTSVVAPILAKKNINIVNHKASQLLCTKMLKTLFIPTTPKKKLMPIRYYEAPDIKQLVDKIVTELKFTHVNSQQVYCYRSRGSKSRRTVARIHGLEKLWQRALKTQPSYLIEVIAERYDKLNQTDQEKVIIHELLHIPKGFSGGFRPHKGYINKKTIDKLHETYKHQKRNNKLFGSK